MEANARITGGAAAILLVLLAVEGATVLRVRALLTIHVIVGMVLLGPVAVKLASTGWRFASYYRGDPAYRRKGPPPVVLRLLGPFVVVLTVVLFASGILVLVGPQDLRHQALFVHRASFFVWFAVMAVHVLGHLKDTARLAPRDWVRGGHRHLAGASTRQALLAASLVVGLGLAAVTVGAVTSYVHNERPRRPFAAHHR